MMRTPRYLSPSRATLLIWLMAFGVVTNVRSASLNLASTTSGKGSTITLPLSYVSGGASAAGVGWSFSYSKGDISSITVSAGPAASGATKNISCNSPAAGTYTCLAIGPNQDVIADGVLANATVTISSATTSTSSTIQVSSVSGVSTNGDAVPVSATSGTVNITTAAPSLSGLTCSPASITSPASAQCTVTLSGAAPSGGMPVALGWTSSGASVSMPSSVTVAAGATSAQFAAQISGASAATTVQLSATANSVTKTFPISVAAPLAISVTLTPSTATVNAGASQQFSASVSGSTNKAVTWSISPAVGTISSTGLYTAPSSVTSSQTVTVRATSAADSSKYGSATVAISAPSTTLVISSTAVTPSSTSAVVTWTTNVAANSRVNYGTSATSLASSAADATMSTSHRVTLSGLTPGTTYYYRVVSADSTGKTVTAPATTSSPGTFKTLTSTVPSGTKTLWSNTTTPKNVSDADTHSVELGLKFYADVAGSVTGVRFYKGSYNTGQHIGHLWSSSGQLLATVVFSNETASGWQQANFSTPVKITAGTTYVISYFAPKGRYAGDESYFSSTSVDVSPLHTVKGAAGVYSYGSTSSFPTKTWNYTNYWVDVVFTPGS